jgi:hypothetical protein
VWQVSFVTSCRPASRIKVAHSADRARAQQNGDRDWQVTVVRYKIRTRQLRIVQLQSAAPRRNSRPRHPECESGAQNNYRNVWWIQSDRYNLLDTLWWHCEHYVKRETFGCRLWACLSMAWNFIYCCFYFASHLVLLCHSPQVETRGTGNIALCSAVVTLMQGHLWY